MSTAHRLVISPVIREGRHHHGQDGPMYSAAHEGEILVASTTQPLLDGARVLQERGLTSALELWGEIRPFPRLMTTIEAAAGLTVQEGKRQSPKFSKWVPFKGLAQAA